MAATNDERGYVVHFARRNGSALCSRNLGVPTGLKISTQDRARVNCKRCVAKLIRIDYLTNLVPKGN